MIDLNTPDKSPSDIAYQTIQERRSKIVTAQTANGEWPLVGEKLKFKSADGSFYPHYTNIIEDAKRLLVKGDVYTVRKCEVYSSWCAVWLEEIPGEFKFHLPMFERSSRYDAVETMIKKLEGLGYTVNKKDEK